MNFSIAVAVSTASPKTARSVIGLTEVEREIGYVNYCVSFVCAMFANCLLGYTVWKRSTTLLKSYRKIFVFHLIIDIALSLMLFLTMCQFIGIQYNNGTKMLFFHLVDGIISNPPQPWTSILSCMVLILINYNITTAAVSFIYRYFLICHHYEITKLPFMGLVIGAGVLPFVYGSLTLNNEMESRSLEERVAYLFNDTDWVEDDGDLPTFGVVVTDAISVFTVITPITILLTYSIVIYCAIRMALRIKAVKHLNARHRQQNQLHIVIFFQAIIPFCTSGLSTLAITTGRIFNLPQPWWYFYVNLLNSWSPVVNPTVALLVIAPYRKYIFKPFYAKLKPSQNDLPYIGTTTTQKMKMTRVMAS